MAAGGLVVEVAAEDGARCATQLVELALRIELGVGLLAFFVTVEGDPAQGAGRVPAAHQADGAPVAIGFLAHQHVLAAGLRARPLAIQPVAVAALVDLVFLLELAVLEVAHHAHELAVLQLLLAHHAARLRRRGSASGRSCLRWCCRCSD